MSQLGSKCEILAMSICRPVYKIEHLRRLLVLRDVERHVLETEDRKMRALIGGHEKRLQYLELLERKNRRG